MTECKVIQVRFYRFVRTKQDFIKSEITISNGIPIQWGVDDICDWVEGKFGDLLNSGWEFSFKLVQ
jgi:hypothetical protein